MTFDLDADDLSRTRFAFSPLWEVVASLRVLADPAAHALHLPWAERARSRLGRYDSALLAALVPPRGYLPDFLTPPPSTPLPDLDAELAALAATSPQQVRRDLAKAHPGGLPDTLAPLRDRPSHGLRRVAAALRDHWDELLAPHWPRLRSVLEGDVVHRAREQALHGSSRVFSGLHEAVRWTQGRLEVDKPFDAGVPAGHGGLLLVPVVFAWPDVLVLVRSERPVLVYPPRGTALLWHAAPPPAPAALAALMGSTRASLLLATSSPSSTTELAHRIGLTPGAVSQHLQILRAAGLVQGHRAGRAVLYARTEPGDAVIRAGRADPGPPTTGSR